MQEQKLADDSHQKMSNPKYDGKNDLEMIFDDLAMLCKQNQLTAQSKLVIEFNKESETKDYCITLSMIVDLCGILSFLVRLETRNESQAASANGYHTTMEADGDNDNNDSRVRMILNLSKAIMRFLDTDNASKLPPEDVDRIVLGCLLDAYRLPSVVNDFETETKKFYKWWRRHIKGWVGEPWSNSKPSGDCYQRLGWRHLTAMIRETRDHLRPPPLSAIVMGARSKEVNGEYKLVGGCYSSVANNTVEDTQEIFYRYYGSRKVTYEKTTIDGRTFSLCLCGVNHSPTSTTQEDTGYSIWFITELDEEQPNTDCDTDYYCALPRNGKCKRTNPVPPLSGWKRCSHGLFPPPSLIPSTELAHGGTCGGSDTHWQHLARWILEEDLLAICWWWCTHKPRSDDVDSGVASIMECMIDIYEEGGENNPGEIACSSLGTELLVKFAVSCLEGWNQRGQC